MIKIDIQGIKDGKYDIEISEPVKEVADISELFFGDISVSGKMMKYHNRFAIDCVVSCTAKLICDISVKEFDETIEFAFRNSYIADSEIFFDQKERDLRDNEERAIHEDDKFIDITDEVREELEVHIPMKRIAPELRDKDFEDIHPEYSNKKDSTKKKNKEIDDRWGPLKNLKLN